MAKRQPSERVQQLRATVLRAERNATSKASRLTARGADVRGTSFDPRKGSKAINRMNTSQLEAHLGRLNTFNARATRFVGTAEGPVGGKVANEYFTALRKRNAISSQNLSRYGDLKPPHSAETLNQAFAKTDVAQRRMANPTADSPFRKLDSIGVLFKNMKSLMKVTDTINKQTNEIKSGKRTEDLRDEVSKLLDSVPMPEYEAFVGSMDNEAFNLMMNVREVMDNLASDYGLVQSGLSVNNSAFQDAIREHEVRALEIAEWAVKESMGRRL